ncbi:adenylosuccinate lyase [Serinicoccus kebangsaanensis]|uniref:adenylosuccinate lyase n=1 Tax=Serinicoccus kebangsaanensis TaxID=2602069 RepID=UPI00124D7F1F|nr:adenylosuccinate lyase [Serinicoccus kebangsaanensis]
MPLPASRTPLAELDPAPSLGALDGRYRGAVAPLVDHLSEAALNRARLHVEVEWLIHLVTQEAVPGAPALTEAEQAALRALVVDFDAATVTELAQIEAETVHDVKAIEYFLRRRLADILQRSAQSGQPGDVATRTAALAELIHFACTSEDINNTSYALLVQGAIIEVWLPKAHGLVDQLAAMAGELADVPLLAHTHGQPATPTTMGKELAVLAHRLTRQLRRVERCAYLGKLNGATGTYGAHVEAVPGADWQQVSRTFVEHLGLQWNPLTTQIESHDWQAELYADVARFNRILHNLATDMWTYISMGYFAQVRGQGTVGSSTMPHKVNPIRFENAEANLEVSNALLDVLASTLVTSRLQRDLTDSSMQRNIGTALGHSVLALDNVGRGLAGLDAVPEAMAADLDANWEVLAEPIQSVMRALAARGAEGMSNPYERLKELTRGRRIGQAELVEFVRGLGLPPQEEERLAALTPATYVGLAPELVRHLEQR